MLRRSVALRLVSLSLLALLPGAAILAYAHFTITAARQVEVREEALADAQVAASEMDAIVDGMENLLVVLGHTRAVSSFDEPACNALLHSTVPSLPQLRAVAVYDATGVERCSSLPNVRGIDIGNDPSFRKAMGTSALVVGEYTEGWKSLPAILPVFRSFDVGGERAGVIVAALDLDWLSQRIARRPIPEGGSLTISDRNGMILVRRPYPERFVGTRIPVAFTPLINAAAPGAADVMSQDGVRRVLGYVPANQSPASGLYVSAGLSVNQQFHALSTTAGISAILSVCWAAIMIVGSWLYAERVFSAPLRAITRVLRRWRSGDQAARTGMSAASGEIGALGAQVDRMIVEIERGNRQRALLAEELSHRMKNMFAIVNAIAWSSFNRDEPARELLPTYLDRISAFAKTHEVLTKNGWDAADLAALITHAAEPLGLSPGEHFTLQGPPVLLPGSQAINMTMVLHELFTNALKHGALSMRGGSLSVRWSMTPVSEGDRLELVWSEVFAGHVPKPTAAHSAGFGSKLLKHAFGAQGQAVLDLTETGLTCRIRLLMSKLEQERARLLSREPPAATIGDAAPSA